MLKFTTLAALITLTAGCTPTPAYPNMQSYKPDAPKVASGPLCRGGGGYTKDSSNPLMRGESEGERPLELSVSVVASGSCSKISAATVEVWHALPSGSYSSLDPEKEADCRGTYKSGGSFTVSTLVPGSYGLLNGLGPSGFDTPPYGPKLIHFRVTAPGYKTLVTEVQLGEGLDFRGPSMVIDGVRTSVEGLLEGESGNMSGKVKLVLEASSEATPDSLCFESLLPKFMNPAAFFSEPMGACGKTLSYFEM
ncbi:hypothetical protein TrRE_jg6411 [Triparma retinervis]|uniref:Intradiol ring-cleavage dioxygenases domain-containing protein n=1 Tax=Triparma retinervis TaxID=2557542 RepID=A0A9W7CIF8_9STRA|nr:hypothetical protein TrRE_jg6411 [Triparma retinervis]